MFEFRFVVRQGIFPYLAIESGTIKREVLKSVISLEWGEG